MWNRIEKIYKNWILMYLLYYQIKLKYEKILYIASKKLALPSLAPKLENFPTSAPPKILILI